MGAVPDGPRLARRRRRHVRRLLLVSVLRPRSLESCEVRRPARPAWVVHAHRHLRSMAGTGERRPLEIPNNDTRTRPLAPKRAQPSPETRWTATDPAAAPRVHRDARWASRSRLPLSGPLDVPGAHKLKVSSVHMTTAADPLTDPELLETEWDLAPLVDGEGRAGAERKLDEARTAPTSSPPPTPARSPSSTPRTATAMRELEEINELIGAPARTRPRFSTDTADPARGALLQLVQERATEIETLLLFFELEWARSTTSAPMSCSPSDRARPLPPPPAQRAALPPAPALGERGEDPRREVDLEPGGVGPPVRRAGARRSASTSTTSELTLTSRSAACCRPTARCGERRRRRLGRARAGPADTRVHLQHARLRQVGRGPAAALPELAGEPQPRQRGLRRVRDGPDQGGTRSLRHPQRWYRLKAKLLGVDRLADYDRSAPVLAEDVMYS